MDIAADFVVRATREHNVAIDTTVLHPNDARADEGLDYAGNNAATRRAASFSRPRVSDDSPYAEAQFRTLKYRTGFR